MSSTFGTETKPSDLFIIGGGVNGTAIARDAQGRGLSTILAETCSIGQQTSSATTKLIHGGLRYLEQWDFRLVRESLLERSSLLNIAPHITYPRPIIIPWLPTMRKQFFIRLGLWIYDNLARQSDFPRSYKFNGNKHNFGTPLKDNYETGFVYYDAYTQDQRWAILNALDAKQHGAQINCQQKVIKAIKHKNLWQITTEDTQNQKTYEYFSKVLINAAGPWVSSVNKDLNLSSDYSIERVKGSHIIVPKFYHGNHCYLLQHPDNRVIFVIPIDDNFLMIGTTDIIDSTNPYDSQIDTQEQKYLLDICDLYFKHKLNLEDIKYSFSGVRPLITQDKKHAQNLSRDYILEWQNNSPPLLTVFGGKLTTHRALAEQVMMKLGSYFDKIKRPWTKHIPLPGAADYDIKQRESYIQTFIEAWPGVSKQVIERWIDTYGTILWQWLDKVKNTEDLGPCFAGVCYGFELLYLKQNEWLFDLDDFLWHRTKCGLYFNNTELEKLKAWWQLQN